MNNVTPNRVVPDGQETSHHPAMLVMRSEEEQVLGALLDPRVSDAVVHKGRTSVLLVPENDETDPVELPVSDR
ncbi:hypothetical protein [Streptomyces flaveolus]|uniref:hypothetical protein n=1 Tax=Streptomyces flaveolus TaxID=67297 RepID=UPI00342C304C